MEEWRAYIQRKVATNENLFGMTKKNELFDNLIER